MGFFGGGGASKLSELTAVSGEHLITTAPTASATKALVRLGAAISGGSANGTYLGINAAAGYGGNFLDFQVNGADYVYVTGTGKALFREEIRVSRDTDGITTAYSRLQNVFGGNLGLTFGTGTSDHYLLNLSSGAMALYTKRAGSGSNTGFRFCSNNLLAGLTNTDNTIVSYTEDNTANFGDPSLRWASLHATTLRLTAAADADIPAITKGTATQSGNLHEWQNSAAGILLSVSSGGHLTFGEAINLIFGTTTGTKIGTATTQKIGFWAATPVVQPINIVDADGTLADITTKFNSLLTKLETIGLLAA
ncbi:MAG: hypothetical protein Q7T33_02615 [Dehalococcoidia bacterium]|nr:hypothetical protein [Dehalococcoidia bacterium]